jgi:tRNA 2-selenouridine synthase SelU
MTAPELPIVDFLAQSRKNLLIDVRAPIEFQNGHLTDAINIPLFEDAERSEIGTLYKQQGKDIAVGRGLEIVSPKMVAFVNQVRELAIDKKVFVYCSRGGMRSSSFAWLMNTAGLDAKILKGGYKSFRNHLINYFKIPKKLVRHLGVSMKPRKILNNGLMQCCLLLFLMPIQSRLSFWKMNLKPLVSINWYKVFGFK